MQHEPPRSTGNSSADIALGKILEAALRNLRAGERVEFDALVAAHPQYADELRDLLPMAEMLLEVGRPEPAGEQPAEEGAAAPAAVEPIGDFTIIRELGRGGMGIVYEAEQRSLRRRVALKVLPMAAMLDRHHLLRFQNEARAAATLHHPNIVPVFAVGCDRGIHYYAMQLIEGRSLFQLIEQLRADEQRRAAAAPSPAHNGGAETQPLVAATTIPHFSSEEYYQTVARLGVEAAEALEHAHARGILHRDVKPANLLLDDTGRLWITDFGLAQLSGDAGLTMTGDFLGTLRYMSPEQALGHRGAIDLRTDIYSLGVTLYELLTLEPPYGEVERPELLRRVAFDESPSLRRTHPRAPTDLATILAKAMEKDPASRYKSAQELADDLRRFLARQPIRAKSATVLDRLVKYSRRHHALVMTAGVALAILCTVLLLSTLLVNGARRQALTALDTTSDLLYTSDMTLAFESFDKGWLDEVRIILDRHRPARGEPDRRGLEWALLDQLTPQPAFVELAGHKGAVNEIAVSADGRRLASVGDDGTLRLWDLETRQPIKVIQLSDRELAAVALSPDGRYAAAGGMDSCVYICDRDRGYEPKDIHMGEYGIESLAFSHDSQRITAGYRYAEVCLLSLDGKLLARVGCTSRAKSLQFLPESSSLLMTNRRNAQTPKQTGVAQLWHDDLSSLQQEFDSSTSSARSEITMARVSPDGKFLLAGEDYTSRVLMFDRESGELLAETPRARDRLLDIAFSPDSDAIAASHQNGNFEYYSFREGPDSTLELASRPLVVRAHRGETFCLRFVDANTLATAGKDGLIRLWTLPTDEARAYRLTKSDLRFVKLSPDASLMLCEHRQNLIVADSRTGNALFRRSAKKRIKCTAWAPSSDRVAFSYDEPDKSPVVLDLEGNEVWKAPAPGIANTIAFSPTRRHVALLSRELQIYDMATNRLVLQRSMPQPGWSAAFSPDGRRLACGGEWPGVCIIDVARNEELRRLECDSDVQAIEYSPDGKVLATSHGDAIIRLWNLDSGRLKAELVGHDQVARAICFSRDGSRLISTSLKDIRVWSVDHLRGFGSVQYFSGRAQGDNPSCRMTADGRELVVAFVNPYNDPAVRIFPLPGHRDDGDGER